MSTPATKALGPSPVSSAASGPRSMERRRRASRRSPEAAQPPLAAEDLAAMGLVRCLQDGCTVWIDPLNVPGPVRCPGCSRIVAGGAQCGRCGAALQGAEPVRRCGGHHLEWVRERRRRQGARPVGDGRVRLPDRHGRGGRERARAA